MPASDRDADLLEFVQRHCHTLYHPVGTCAIGSVVDSQLRVLGVEYRDRENVVELLVEGEGDDHFKYRWRPGFAVVHHAVHSQEDITERLTRETEKIPEERGIC